MSSEGHSILEQRHEDKDDLYEDEFENNSDADLNPPSPSHREWTDKLVQLKQDASSSTPGSYQRPQSALPTRHQRRPKAPKDDAKQQVHNNRRPKSAANRSHRIAPSRPKSANKSIRNNNSTTTTSSTISRRKLLKSNQISSQVKGMYYGNEASSKIHKTRKKVNQNDLSFTTEPEVLLETMHALKAELKEEHDIKLKANAKIRRLEERLVNRDRRIEELLKSRSSSSGLQPSAENAISSVEKHRYAARERKQEGLIKKLKARLASQDSVINKLENKLNEQTAAIRSTKVKELTTERDEYFEEILRLRDVIRQLLVENSTCKSSKDSTTNVPEKSSSSNDRPKTAARIRQKISEEEEAPVKKRQLRKKKLPTTTTTENSSKTSQRPATASIAQRGRRHPPSDKPPLNHPEWVRTTKHVGTTTPRKSELNHSSLKDDKEPTQQQIKKLPDRFDHKQGGQNSVVKNRPATKSSSREVAVRKAQEARMEEQRRESVQSQMKRVIEVPTTTKIMKMAEIENFHSLTSDVANTVVNDAIEHITDVALVKVLKDTNDAYHSLEEAAHLKHLEADNDTTQSNDEEEPGTSQEVSKTYSDFSDEDEQQQLGDYDDDSDFEDGAELLEVGSRF